jgi:hypothetical protein
MTGRAEASAETLREELLALPGVSRAEVDLSGDGASGVRVRLGGDADARRVGLEVQRVLASHGMRSRVEAESGAPRAMPEETAAPPVAGSGPQVETVQAVDLASVHIEESGEMVTVTVTTTDGRSETRAVGVNGNEMAGAVAEASGLLAVGGSPTIVSVTWTEAGGSDVVTVVAERIDGVRAAGAAVVRASRGYALARAVWSALTGRT